MLALFHSLALLLLKRLAVEHLSFACVRVVELLDGLDKEQVLRHATYEQRHDD